LNYSVFLINVTVVQNHSK